MHLSACRARFLIIGLIPILIAGCRGPRPVPPAPENAGAEQTSLPFKTTEPQTFQADLVMTSAGVEHHWFVARKGDKTRFDILDGTSPWLTKLSTDKIYLIDHKGRIYAKSTPANLPRSFNDDITKDFFRVKQYHGFEAAGEDEHDRIYKVTKDETNKDDITIYVDKATGLIVRQELVGPASAVRYEMRDLKLNADDTVFTLPTGYKEVPIAEFSPAK